MACSKESCYLELQAESYLRLYQAIDPVFANLPRVHTTHKAVGEASGCNVFKFRTPRKNKEPENAHKKRHLF